MEILQKIKKAIVSPTHLTLVRLKKIFIITSKIMTPLSDFSAVEYFSKILIFPTKSFLAAIFITVPLQMSTVKMYFLSCVFLTMQFLMTAVSLKAMHIFLHSPADSFITHYLHPTTLYR